MTIDTFDVIELARIIVGADDNADDDDISQKLYDMIEMDLDQLYTAVSVLAPYTIPAKTALRNELCHGFVHDGAFIVKVSKG